MSFKLGKCALCRERRIWPSNYKEMKKDSTIEPQYPYYGGFCYVCCEQRADEVRAEIDRIERGE